MLGFGLGVGVGHSGVGVSGVLIPEIKLSAKLPGEHPRWGCKSK